MKDYATAARWIENRFNCLLRGENSLGNKTNEVNPYPTLVSSRSFRYVGPYTGGQKMLPTPDSAGPQHNMDEILSSSRDFLNKSQILI